MMCVYIHTYIYIVIPNHIPEASGPQQLKLIRFQIYRDIPFTHHNIVYYVFIVCHYLYIYISFSISTKSSLYPQHTMIFHVPIATYYTNQDIPFACTNKYIYIPLVYDLFITSVPLFIPLAFMYLYIYTVGWSLASHLFISTYVYTILHCIPNIPLYIHQYITLAYHWLIHRIQKKHDTYTNIYIYILLFLFTSSTAQGGGGSFKNRKPIGEIGCCESGMAERIHWWTERCLRSPLFLSLSLTIYLPTSLSSMYLSIYRSIYLSLSLFHLITYLPIYLCTYLPIYLSISLSLSSVYLSSCLPVCLSICLSVYLSICGAVSFSVM